jgi:hypothetical protein
MRSMGNILCLLQLVIVNPTFLCSFVIVTFMLEAITIANAFIRFENKVSFY